MPSGSAFLRLSAYLTPMNATIATATPATIHFHARFDGFLTMTDSLYCFPAGGLSEASGARGFVNVSPQ